ncbi:MAG: histidinol-phosphate transaminase [Bacteroidota bacterium]|nr:histidinol-phosphate transaminase [Bacteroidota bacterium]
MFDIDKLTRDNIRALEPYSSARNEYSGDAAVLLDANENPYNYPFNRYPDPLQKELRGLIAQQKKIKPSQVFTGNGSDEAIDLVIRAFCEPGQHNIVSLDPSYGMYSVAAHINNVEFRKVSLTPGFNIDMKALVNAVDANTRLIFLCSPNNPTANSFEESDLLSIIEHFKGLVVVDEAYIDFSSQSSLVKYLDKLPNLIIFQTLSKAWAMAGIRLGMAFAQPDIIAVFDKIKYPYNVNYLTQQKAIEGLRRVEEKENWVKLILMQKKELIEKLSKLKVVEKIYPSDANFFLAKVIDPINVYKYLVDSKIIVRNRSTVHLCEGCMRISVGSKEENELLVKALSEYKN